MTIQDWDTCSVEIQDYKDYKINYMLEAMEERIKIELTSSLREPTAAQERQRIELFKKELATFFASRTCIECVECFSKRYTQCRHCPICKKYPGTCSCYCTSCGGYPCMYHSDLCNNCDWYYYD